MACGVFFAGLPVRRFLRGQAKKSLNPMRAMRTLVLAQAAALTGALVAGWYLAQVLVLLPDFDIDSRRTLAVRLAALAAGGVLMAIAGLVAQAMCRVDKGDDGDHGDDGDDGTTDDQHPLTEHLCATVWGRLARKRSMRGVRWATCRRLPRRRTSSPGWRPCRR